MGVLKQLGSVIATVAGGLMLLLAGSSNAFAFGGLLSAPEIDPASLCSAVTLLIGGAMLLKGRRELK
jgi:hypothetical protein